jgi:hypothetical protein
MADGVLTKVGPHTWRGTLYGYTVHVFYSGDSWCFAVINPHGHTQVCPRVGSFAEGARRAREWIEARQGN